MLGSYSTSLILENVAGLPGRVVWWKNNRKISDIYHSLQGLGRQPAKGKENYLRSGCIYYLLWKRGETKTQ